MKRTINGYKLEIYKDKCLSRFVPRFSKAQVFIDSSVLKDSAPFTPMRTGFLMSSGTTGTRLGTGEVVYNAPYARSMYYALDFNFSRDKHPQAGPQWFEVAKAIKKKEWIDGANKIVRGDML